MFKRLTLAVILCASSALADPRLVFSGRASIQDAGGLSGLELNANGQTGITVSDRGEVFAIRLKRNNGALGSVALTPWPTRRKIAGDVEGIATLDDDSFYFSLEGPAKVVSLNPNGKITPLPKHPDFAKMQSNRALEAIAIDKQGTLYTLAEATPKDATNLTLFAFKDGAWTVKAMLPKSGSFLAVGADFGADGWFYLLERTVTPLGFRTRVRRFDLNQDPVIAQTLLSTWPSHHDNLEGMSLWTDDAGKTRVTMISDDNFLPIQRSEVVEYVLQE
jgi:hypothetical protein